MIDAKPVWIKEGDVEWAVCGSLKAVITRVSAGNQRTVGVTVRIMPNDGAPDADYDTPAIREFAADQVAREIDALKEKVEREMVSRAAEIAGTRAE